MVGGAVRQGGFVVSGYWWIAGNFNAAQDSDPSFFIVVSRCEFVVLSVCACVLV